ncbi:MAG: hypothetical protein EBY29_17705, partial [Planctomycetes bacterium]|nr:hypothetical protein [Planctomycetota bacterium]
MGVARFRGGDCSGRMGQRAKTTPQQRRWSPMRHIVARHLQFTTAVIHSTHGTAVSQWICRAPARDTLNTKFYQWRSHDNCGAGLMTRICVIEPIGISTEEIRSALPGHDVDVFDSRGWADSELIARCAGAEVLASTNRPISVSVIDALEGLRLIAIAFAGVDSVAAAAAESHGVTVTNARGYADTAVAELTVGLMISLARQIPAQNVAIRSGGTTSMGTQLRGKTI